MKLITETIEDIDILTEANAKGGKDYKIRGVFMQADIKNRNGRVYPVGTLQTEVNRYTKEFIDKKTERVINGSIDSILRGMGVGGTIVSTVKNMINS